MYWDTARHVRGWIVVPIASEEQMMRAVTAADAKHDLEQLIEQVIADAEPTIVITDAGQQVVVVPLAE